MIPSETVEIFNGSVNASKVRRLLLVASEIQNSQVPKMIHATMNRNVF